MATEVSISNSALAKIGAERILSLDENSVNARLCKEQYEKVLEDMIRAHPWNFATKRVALSASTTTPAFQYSYQYGLPNDCLRVLAVEDGEEIEWVREGRFILSDSTTMKIKYVSSDIQPGDFDANFAEAFATRLAADICYSLNQSTSLKETLLKEAEFRLSQARSFDAQEGTPPRVYADEWLISRY